MNLLECYTESGMECAFKIKLCPFFEKLASVLEQYTSNRIFSVLCFPLT